MAGKPKDYDTLIDYYTALNKQRALTAEESEKLYKAVEGKRQQQASLRYRAKRAEEIKQRKALLEQCPQRAESLRQQRTEASRTYYARNRTRLREEARLRRLANPELVAKHRQRRSRHVATLNCGHCGVEFTASAGTAAKAAAGSVRYCHVRCMHKAAAVEFNFNCAACGVAVRRVRSPYGTPPKYCGKACKDKKPVKIKPHAT